MHRQYIPITEAVCSAVASLNAGNRPATLGSIAAAMQVMYPGAALPVEELMDTALSALTANGQLYCAGDRYYLSAAPHYQLFYGAGGGGGPAAENLASLGAPFNLPQYAAALANPAVYHQMAIALQHQYSNGGAEHAHHHQQQQLLQQQQRILRDAAPYYAPSAPAMKTTECQTGASVVDVPPVSRRQSNPTTGRAVGRHATMCTQTGDSHTSKGRAAAAEQNVDGENEGEGAVEDGNGQGKVCAGAGGKDKDSLKPGFFARLFSSKRQKSKDKCAHQQKSNVPKSRTVDSNIHKESSKHPSTSAAAKPPPGPGTSHKSHPTQHKQPHHQVQQAADAQCTACGGHAGTLPRSSNAFEQHTVQLDTFSAQFPPSEWLPDAQLAGLLQQQATASNAHQPTTLPGLSLFRGSGGRPQTHQQQQSHLNTNKQRSSGRRQAGGQQPVQRYCMFPENLAGGAAQPTGLFSPKLNLACGTTPARNSRDRHGSKSHRSKAADYNRREIQQRLSKYLSSSSECLQFLGPVDPPELLPSRCYAELEGIMYDWERRPSKAHSPPPPPPQHKTGGKSAGKSGKLPRSEAMRFHGGEAMIKGDLGALDESCAVPNEEDRTPVAKCSQARRGSKPTNTQCCTLDLDASNASTMDFGSGGQRTSTPNQAAMPYDHDHDEHHDDPFYQSMPALSVVQLQPVQQMHERPVVKGEQGKGGGNRLRPESAGDSALSASPVVTELSSGGQNSNKYSSWSGSEGNPNQRHHGNDVSLDSNCMDDVPVVGEHDSHINHTYINLDHRAKEIPYQDKLLGRDLPPADKTYENVGASNTQATYQTLEDPSNFTSITDVENRRAAPINEKTKASAYISAV